MSKFFSHLLIYSVKTTVISLNTLIHKQNFAMNILQKAHANATESYFFPLGNVDAIPPYPNLTRHRESVMSLVSF